MNFIPGELFDSGGGIAVRLDDGKSLPLPPARRARGRPAGRR